MQPSLHMVRLEGTKETFIFLSFCSFELSKSSLILVCLLALAIRTSVSVVAYSYAAVCF